MEQRQLKPLPSKSPKYEILSFQLGNFIFPVRKFYFSRQPFLGWFGAFLSYYTSGMILMLKNERVNKDD